MKIVKRYEILEEEEISEEVAQKLLKLAEERSKASKRFDVCKHHVKLELVYEDLYNEPQIPEGADMVDWYIDEIN